MIPDDKRQRVLEVLKENDGDYVKTAKDTHTPMQTVREIDIIENKKFGYTPEGKGRKELQKHIVAIRRADESWPDNDPKIQEARDAYDAGKVTLCTGRDGLNMILYAIPKKVIDINPTPYFVEEEEE
jgi:hypothetical protein